MKALFPLLALLLGGLFGCTAPEPRLFAGTVSGVAEIMPDRKIKQLAQTPEVCSMASDGKKLYLSTTAGLYAFAVTKDGLQQFSGPVALKNEKGKIRRFCHITLSPDGCFLYGADYAGGVILQIPMVKGVPSLRGSVLKTEGSGLHRRQRGPHPHWVGMAPSGRYLCAADLGANALFTWLYRPGYGVYADSIVKSPVSPADAGPRQIVFSRSGDKAFVVNELSNSIGMFQFDSGHFEQLCDTPLLPPSSSGKSFAGALKLSPDGSWLFATNRGANTISVVKIGRKKLYLKGSFRSEGDYPGDLAILSPEEAVAANVKDGTLLFFFPGTRALDEVNPTIPLPGVRTLFFCE